MKLIHEIKIINIIIIITKLLLKLLKNVNTDI